MSHWKSHVAVAVVVSLFWIVVLFKPTVGAWRGFVGVHVTQRWGVGGPALQLGSFNNGECVAVTLYLPWSRIPWAIVNDGKRVWIQEGK